jgi:hypothetical protein
MNNILNAWNMNNIQILWPIPHVCEDVVPWGGKNPYSLHYNRHLTLSMLHSPAHSRRHLHPSNCCITQTKLKYEVQLITSNRTAPRYWCEDSDVLNTLRTDTPPVLCHSGQERNCLMLPSWFKVTDTVAEPWLLIIMIQLCPQKCLSLPSMWYSTQPLRAGYNNARRRRLWRHKTFFPGVHWTFTGVLQRSWCQQWLWCLDHVLDGSEIYIG